MKKITLLLITILLSISGFSQALIQGFESPTVPPSVPANWVTFESGTAAEVWFTDSSGPHNGTNSAILYGENLGVGNSAKYYIASPLVTIPLNGQLRFWVKTSMQGDQGGVFKVKIASGALASNQTSEAAYATVLQTYTESQLSTNFAPAPIVYEEQVINFPVATYPAGTQVYIAFVSEVNQTSPFQGDDFYLDDVLVISRCLDPITLAAGTFTPTSAVLSWGNPNPLIGAGLNTCNQWEIEIIPTTQLTPSGSGMIINSNPYTATTLSTAPFAPLSALTSYKYYVRSICAFSSSLWAGPFPFTTAPGLPVCGGNFVDPGGSAGDYAINTTAANGGTTVICPVTSGDLVTVTFTSFSTESGFDFLKVYNGTVSAANLLGNFSGNLAATLPGPFTSTAASGCLTFVFTSDDSVVSSGWLANITCAPIPTCTKPTALTSSAITSDSVSLSWTQPLNPNGTTATAWQYLALPCGSPLPTATTVGWQTASSPPFVANSLTSGTCYDFYVRASCSSTDTSAWSNPRSVLTLPGCGGFFVDPGGATGNYVNNITAATGTTTICPTIPGQLVTVNFTSFNTELNFDFLKVYDGTSNAGTLLGTFSGTTLPGSFTSSDASGCLTFVFTSDISGVAAGWVSNVTCAPPPSCSKPKTLTATAITQSTALLGWFQPANPDGSFASAWQVIALPCGSAVPTATSTGWINATSNPFYITNLNPATCYVYYVRAVCSATDTSFISPPKSFNTLIANDDCIGAIEVPVNQNTSCLQTVTGSLAFATASIEANSCGGTIDDDDVWFKFTATSIKHYITILGVNSAAAPTNINFVLYTGNCGGLTQFGNCVTANNNIISGLTVGQTYYIRVYSTGSAAVTTAFELCIGTNVGTCPTALPLCAITPIIIPNNVGVPTLPNPVSPFSTTSTTVGCLGTAPSPTFYYLQIPTNGNFNFFLEQNTSNLFPAGTGIDVDFVAWGPYTSNAAACAGIATTNAPGTGNSCSFSANFTENYVINNAIAGQIYVVMITNYSGRKGFVRITQTQGPIPSSCCPFGNFTYTKTFYCKNEANPSPAFISNAVAGTFSSTPAIGLSINPATGLINLDASLPGTYIVHNTVGASGTCPSDDDTWTITISAPPSTAGISYSSSTFCNTNTTLQSVTQTGTAGGTYTVVPATGLTLNVSTGAFTPSTSVMGNYTVTYNLPPVGGCLGATSSVNISIVNIPVATFNYDAVTYCKNGNNPIISFPTGASAGVFSSTLGLSLNVITGAIDLANSSLGSYTITNTISGLGGCPTTLATFNIEITATPVAAFDYGSLPYCQNSTNPSPTFGFGGLAGVFSSSSPLLIVNSGTGLIDIPNSTPGTYTVTNTVAASGSCAQVVATAQIIITALPVATFNYNAVTYCKNGANPILSFIGSGIAGVFSSTTGLTITSAGAIDLATSTPGNYVITNTIGASAGCGIVTATFAITITIPLVATFNYFGSPYCKNASNPSPTFAVGGVAGVFTSTTGLFINSLTGEIDLATSIAGTYTVTNTVPAVGNCAAVVATDQVIITALPVAAFNYDAVIYCKNGVNPILSFIGSGVAGVFSSTTGLTITSAGAIDLATSTPGNYVITNTIGASAGCGIVTATFAITITAPQIATFSYTGSPYCKNALNPSPTFSGVGVAGIFTSTTGLILNASTGEIDLTASTAGTYIVTNTIPSGGGCSAVIATTQVTITTAPQATISYTDAFYCYNNSGSQSVNLNGTTGGRYSVAPSGLTISSISGVINASTSQAGAYTVTYTVAAFGGCPQLATTVTVTIIPEIIVELSGVCNGPDFTITALPVSGSFNPLNASYEWSGPNGYIFGPTSTPSIVVVTPGTYISTVTYNGCTNVNSLQVDNTTCSIQKGISPNGDGDNESFTLADVNELSIFNRYGSKVYSHGANYTDQWHGQSSSDSELPDGTYFYVIKRGSGDIITGWIYINR